MITMHAGEGAIGIYTDDLGRPSFKCGNRFIPMVPARSKKASKVRISDEYALSLTGMFNFTRVLTAIVRDGDDVVFKRYNGQEMYRLKPAKGR